MKFPKLALILIVVAGAKVNADCSSPPSTGFSARGFDEFFAWCRACGGTPYTTGGIGCTKGPNWGGSMGSPSGLSPSQQMTVDFMQQMTNQLVNSLDEADAAAKAKAAQEKQRAKEKREAQEREKQQQEQDKFERLSGELDLGGGTSTDEMALKLGDDDPALKPPAPAAAGADLSAKRIAKQNMKILNCQLAAAYEMLRNMGDKGEAESRNLRKELDRLRADLSQPPSGAANTQKIFSKSLQVSESGTKSEQETIVDVKVVRHEDTGRTYLSVMYKGSKGGKNLEEDLSIFVDRNGKIENKEDLPKSIKNCVNSRS